MVQRVDGGRVVAKFAKLDSPVAIRVTWAFNGAQYNFLLIAHCNYEGFRVKDRFSVRAYARIPSVVVLFSGVHPLDVMEDAHGVDDFLTATACVSQVIRYGDTKPNFVRPVMVRTVRLNRFHFVVGFVRPISVQVRACLVVNRVGKVNGASVDYSFWNFEVSRYVVGSRFA